MKMLPNPISLPVSAVSGLVKAGEAFYFVADDENTLGIFSGGNFSSVALFNEPLPLDPIARKKKKPDLESLAFGEGLLYAFPSGSTSVRQTGVSFDPGTQRVSHFSLKSLYEQLSLKIPDLNIEGATFTEDELVLLQRGNGAGGVNAMIHIDRTGFIQEASSGGVSSRFLKSIQEIDLGDTSDFAWGFTDACYAQGSIFFLAVAEGAVSTYEDGKFLGAKIGQMSLEGKILNSLPLALPHKPEGIWVENNTVYVVTDADDRSIPSKLYEMRWDELKQHRLHA